MKVRLIVPECKAYKDHYCIDHHDQELMGGARYYALEEAMNDPKIDLVVTSHNYFFFDAGPYVNAEPIINHLLINGYLNYIPEKIRKPIVVGFDIESEKQGKNIKKKTSSKNDKKPNNAFEKGLNPYGGIDAIVCFLTLGTHRQYQIGTYIWESWYPERDCDDKGFVAQNCSRVFNFYGLTVGLLSCGDIFSYCHDSRKNLPRADLYLNLAHTAYRGQCKKAAVSIQKNGLAQQVFVTMHKKNISDYRKNFPWVIPNEVPATIYCYDDKVRFAFIDCDF